LAFFNLNSIKQMYLDKNALRFQLDLFSKVFQTALNTRILWAIERLVKGDPTLFIGRLLKS
jgi:hypothetical protein